MLLLPSQDRTSEASSPGGAASENDSDSDAESEGGRRQSQFTRGRDESGDSDSESEAEGQADAGAERAGQAEVQPSDEADEAVPDITEAALTTRWSEVFVIGESWPKAVGKPLLAKTVTNKLVKLAIEVVKKLLERDGKALSKSFGNFDQRVALGWLLADARGWPLLEKAHALACGTKAQREGGYIRDAIKLARKAALTAARAAGADAPAAQDEAEAKLLLEAAGDIALPEIPAAPAPAMQPRSAATGARKRKRAPMPTALDALEERLDATVAERKSARKALTKAERAHEAAEKVEAAKLKVANRMLNKIKELPQKSTVKWVKFYHVYTQAERGWQHAQMAAKDAYIARLHAYIDWQDACIDGADVEIAVQSACNAVLAE